MQKLNISKRVNSFLSKADFLQLFAVVFLAACIVVGIALRFYKLGLVPLAPYWDEVAMLADARALLATGQDLHGNSWLQSIFVSYGDFKLPVYIWFTTIASWFVGISPLAVRIPSALAGVTTIALAAIMPWQLLSFTRTSLTKNQKLLISATSAATVAILPWSILFSRTGFEAHLSQSIAGTSVVLLLAVLQNSKHSLQRMLGITVATLVATAAVYTYFSTRFVIPVVFLSILFIEYAQQSEPVLRRVVQWFAVSSMCLLVFAVSLQPMLASPHYVASNQYRLSTKSLLEIEPFVLQSNTWRSIAGNSLLDRIVFHRRVLQLQALTQNVALHVSPSYLFFTGDTNLRHGTGNHGIVLLSTAPFLLIGWIWLIKRSPFLAALLGIWWLTAIIPAAIPSETPHALRSLNALLPISISIGIGAAILGFWLEQHTSKLTAGCIVVLLCVAPAIEFSRFMQHYFAVYPSASSLVWQHGYTAVAKTVGEWSKTHEVILLDSDPRIMLWVMAFSDIDPALISTTIQQQGPLPSKVGVISIQPLEAVNLSTIQQPVLLVGTVSTLQSFILSEVQQPHTTVTISTADPEYQFMAVEYVQN